MFVYIGFLEIESIAFPQSHCISCGYNLKPKDLIEFLAIYF